MTRLTDALAAKALRPEAPYSHVSAVPWRAALAAAVILATVAAFAAGRDAASAWAVQASGPELTQLLRFMAVVKLGMALGASGLAWWRLGNPLSAGLALSYLAACALMAAAPGLIWSMGHVVLGAVLFHAGFALLLLLGWADRGEIQAATLGRLRLGQRLATGTATSLRRNGGSVQGGS